MERIMEQLEVRCYDGLQEAMKTTEGIGIEYDEDVVCDICRSVCCIARQTAEKLFKPAPAEAICFRVVRPCVRPCIRPSVIHVVVLCFRDISSIC